MDCSTLTSFSWGSLRVQASLKAMCTSSLPKRFWSSRSRRTVSSRPLRKWKRLTRKQSKRSARVSKNLPKLGYSARLSPRCYHSRESLVPANLISSLSADDEQLTKDLKWISNRWVRPLAKKIGKGVIGSNRKHLSISTLITSVRALIASVSASG